MQKICLLETSQPKHRQVLVDPRRPSSYIFFFFLAKENKLIDWSNVRKSWPDHVAVLVDGWMAGRVSHRHGRAGETVLRAEREEMKRVSTSETRPGTGGVTLQTPSPSSEGKLGLIIQTVPA